ncbi:MAG TPA: NAD(P)H-binding protein [Chitinophagaceae bacterium]|nr:NAD(P)H-binding protein [Chitinophagaceae bacterium]
MSAKTATIIGVTGLIGGYLYEALKQDKTYEAIRLIVRRPFVKDNDRTEVKLVDFNDAESFKLAIDGSDVVFCAIGTTQKKVKGDKAAYRKIDYDIPLKTARFCKETGCETFILVSSVGANGKSNSFYLKLKGEVEDAIKATGLRSVHIMRPSMLLGDRKEFRLGEKIGKPLMTALSFLLPSKYKPIHAKKVATAMLNVAKENKEGFFVYEYKEIEN